MSGGVDSSVAAYLMQKNGYDCMGVTMKLFDNGDIGISKGHTCCSLDDVEDARSVARRLGIPYYVFNFSDRFNAEVIDKFISAYENGETDVLAREKMANAATMAGMAFRQTVSPRARA